VNDCTLDTEKIVEIINNQKTSKNIGLIEPIVFWIDIAKMMKQTIKKLSILQKENKVLYIKIEMISLKFIL
jgi:hypothetical protein